MMLNRIWKTISLGLERSARREARRQLLAMTDRSLADAGFSRKLLEEGVSAWPWLKPPEQQHTPLCFNHGAAELATPTGDEFKRAVAELHSYTDAELADLGIARSGIADAVRHGRHGVDELRRQIA